MSGVDHHRSSAVLVIAGLENQARAACARAGIEPVLVLSRDEWVRDPLGARRAAARLAPELVVIHSPDWARQSLAPLFELAAVLLPGARRIVLDGDGARGRELTRRGVWARTLALPGSGLAAAAAVASELGALRAALDRPVPRAPGRLDPARDPILAIWRGDPSAVTGGAVTHAAGILGALRRAGFRVGLLTACPPPPQVRRAVDEIEVADPMPAAQRISREVEDICVNAVLREAGESLIARLGPAVIYQRSDAFLACGIELSAAHGLPLILEWNGSAVWVRRHWRVQRRVKHAFDRVLATVETESLRRSVLIRAVSERAAEMAREGGALRVVTIPNAVDITAIPAPVPLPADPLAPVIGWVGSFGPWHGAPLLVRAVARLPHVRALMIGEGPGRPAAQALARELGVAERVEFVGMLPHEQTVARLSACDLLASPHVPSDGQAFFGSPTKIFEFMAIGRPIVASALEQIADVLADGRTACLVAPGDLDDLVRGLRQVLALADGGAALGRAARAEVQAHHTWDVRAADLVTRVAAPLGDPVAM